MYSMAECGEDGNKENKELQEIIIAEIKRVHGTHKAAEADSITNTLAKKHGLSNSEVAITLQYLIASGKILKRAREGDADSLVFPKENEKKPEKVSIKKKSNAQKGNTILTENFEVQETNVTVAIGDLVRSLNLTNELLQKERDFSKDLLIENNNLKIAIKEKEFEIRELSTRIMVFSQNPLRNFTKPSSPKGIFHCSEKRQPIPTAPFVDLEKNEDNEILSNTEWPFLSSSNNKRRKADNNNTTEWSTIPTRNKARNENQNSVWQTQTQTAWPKELNRFEGLEHEDTPTFCGAATENEASTYSAAIQRPKNRSNLKHREGPTSKRRGKPTTYILGDSMVKDIKGFKMAKATGNEEQVYVKSFSGANVKDMNSHVVPALNRAPQKIILHCGTNDLSSEQTPAEIANSIVKLAAEMKDEDNEIFVSGLVRRNDEFNGKAIEVNKFLSRKCSLQNFPFIDNSNIDERCHLNGSGLHLNYGGTCILANNFLNTIGF